MVTFFLSLLRTNSPIVIACRERALFHAAWLFRVLFPKLDRNAAIMESAHLQSHPAPFGIAFEDTAIVHTFHVSAAKQYINHCSTMGTLQVNTECLVVRIFLHC